MKQKQHNSSRRLYPSCSALRAKLWALHELAELEMLTVAREKPRRPWYRKRAARVSKNPLPTLIGPPRGSGTMGFNETG